MGTDIGDADDFCATVSTVSPAVSFLSQPIDQQRIFRIPPPWEGLSALCLDVEIDPVTGIVKQGIQMEIMKRRESFFSSRAAVSSFSLTHISNNKI